MCFEKKIKFCAEHRGPAPIGMEERERCLDKSVPLIQLVCRSLGYSCWRIHPPPDATQEVERGPHVECEPELHPQHERSLIFKYFKAERRSRPKTNGRNGAGRRGGAILKRLIQTLIGTNPCGPCWSCEMCLELKGCLVVTGSSCAGTALTNSPFHTHAPIEAQFFQNRPVLLVLLLNHSEETY